VVSAFPKRPVSQDAVLEALEAVAVGLGAKIDGVEKRTAEKIAESEERTAAKIVESEERTTAKIVESEERTTAKIVESEERTTAKIEAVDAKVDNLRSEFEDFKQEVRHGFRTIDDNFLEMNRKFNTLIALIGAKPAE
jgi:K+/H+ antiporter YhaU regulatory subunit KhtT